MFSKFLPENQYTINEMYSTIKKMNKQKSEKNNLFSLNRKECKTKYICSLTPSELRERIVKTNPTFHEDHQTKNEIVKK